MSKIVIAKKQTDIDLITNRINDLNSLLDAFAVEMKALNIDFKTEDLKRATQQTKDFILEKLGDRLTETPQLAGLKLSKMQFYQWLILI